MRVPNLDVLFAACPEEIVILSFNGMSLDEIKRVKITEQIQYLSFQGDSLICKPSSESEIISIRFSGLNDIFEHRSRKLDDTKEFMSLIDDYTLKTFRLPQGGFC